MHVGKPPTKCRSALRCNSVTSMLRNSSKGFLPNIENARNLEMIGINSALTVLEIHKLELWSFHCLPALDSPSCLSVLQLGTAKHHAELGGRIRYGAGPLEKVRTAGSV